MTRVESLSHFIGFLAQGEMEKYTFTLLYFCSNFDRYEIFMVINPVLISYFLLRTEEFDFNEKLLLKRNE